MEYREAPTQPEVWKPLPLEGAHYEISSHGRVRTVGHCPRYIQPKQVRGNNYVVRLLFRDAQGVPHVVYRSLPKLVADVFLPPSNLPLIGFRNGDRADCWVENLYRKDYNYAMGVKVKPGRGELRREEARGMLLSQQVQWDNMTYAEQQELMQKYRPPVGIKLKGPDEKRLPYAEGETPPPQPDGPTTHATTPQEIQKQTTENIPTTASTTPAHNTPRLQSDWLPGALAALDAEIDSPLSNEGE